MSLDQLSIRIFADGADKPGILALNDDPLIKGFTTNPSLMRKAGISDYETFARDILKSLTDKPISFEVFSDDFPEMKRQALKINSWHQNVYVKIPITNTLGESSLPLITELAKEGVKVNVTAVMTTEQVARIVKALQPNVPAVVSIFAGRIADTGVNPMPTMTSSVARLQELPLVEVLWASVREVLNIFQADEAGCDIVTVPHDILAKAKKMIGTDATILSLDTVKMFATDAQAAGFTL